MLDATTGLLYVGNGQYYDPATGRFLTRGVNPDSTNPYVPWNPIGAILGPLGLIALVFGRKKKGSKAGMFLALVLVVGSVGMTLAGCVSVPAGQYTVTATSTPGAPINYTATFDNGLTVTGTLPASTETPIPSAIYTCTVPPTPTPDQPLRPANLDPSLEYVWETYINLWNNKDGWWWNSTSGTKRFLPADFFGWLHHFEFSTPRPDGLDDGTAEEASVGSFCFYSTRSEDSKWEQVKICNPNPTDVEIFRYLHERGLLKYGPKNYSVTGTPPKYSAWLARENDFKATKFTTDFAGALISPSNPRWLDWRNSNGIDDPIVEWGNKQPGHQPDLYKNFAKLNRDAVEGRLTNQIAKKVGNAYFFTFCQYVYYGSGGGIASNSKCGDPGHFELR